MTDAAFEDGLRRATPTIADAHHADGAAHSTLPRQFHGRCDDDPAKGITSILHRGGALHQFDAIGAERIEVGRVLPAPLLVLLPHPLVEREDAVAGQALHDRFGDDRSGAKDSDPRHAGHHFGKGAAAGPFHGGPVHHRSGHADVLIGSLPHHLGLLQLLSVVLQPHGDGAIGHQLHFPQHRLAAQVLDAELHRPGAEPLDHEPSFRIGHHAHILAREHDLRKAQGRTIVVVHHGTGQHQRARRLGTELDAEQEDEQGHQRPEEEHGNRGTEGSNTNAGAQPCVGGPRSAMHQACMTRTWPASMRSLCTGMAFAG